MHLETALKGIIIGDRWPKSGVEVVVTILEGEEDQWCGDLKGTPTSGGTGGVSAGWGMMNVLAGCITVASAAIADAGIDCVDLVAGGVAAVVAGSDDRPGVGSTSTRPAQIVLDPCPAEHQTIQAACVVGYLSSRDEITELWMKGDMPGPEEKSNDTPNIDDLINDAVRAANGTRSVLAEAVKEAAMARLAPAGNQLAERDNKGDADVVMTT